MVRLTDRPDMTLDVYSGRKTTMQQQQSLTRSAVWFNKGGKIKCMTSCFLFCFGTVSLSSYPFMYKPRTFLYFCITHELRVLFYFIFFLLCFSLCMCVQGGGVLVLFICLFTSFAVPDNNLRIVFYFILSSEFNAYCLQRKISYFSTSD